MARQSGLALANPTDSQERSTALARLAAIADGEMLTTQTGPASLQHRFEAVLTLAVLGMKETTMRELLDPTSQK